MSSSNKRKKEPNKETIKVIVENENFIVEKKLLVDSCHYFNVMFNGSFKESKQKEIQLNIVTPTAFRFILDYLETNTVRMFNVSQATEIMVSVNYLNLRPLLELVLYKLRTLVNNETCFRIYKIAENCNMLTLKILTRPYILLKFDEVQSNIVDIPNLESLFSYLSHINLNATREIDVFRAGCRWMKENKQEDINNILLVLSCVIFKRLNVKQMEYIREHPYVQKNSTALNVVRKILNLHVTGEIHNITNQQNNEVVSNANPYTEIVYNFLKAKEHRIPALIPCIVAQKRDIFTIYNFDSSENEFYEYKCFTHSGYWGISVVPWKKYLIIVTCGVKRKENVWNRKIEVYDCFRAEWLDLFTLLPTPRRHAISLIHNDYLYLMGGIGIGGSKLQTVVNCNLKSGEWKSLPDLPSKCALAVATVHIDNIYIASDCLYVLQRDKWVLILQLPCKIANFVSHKNDLYFVQISNNMLCCWRNTNFVVMEEVAQFQEKVVGLCKLGRSMYAFTKREVNSYINIQNMEYKENIYDNDTLETRVLWTQDRCDEKFYGLPGGFLLPACVPGKNHINDYGKRWLPDTSQ